MKVSWIKSCFMMFVCILVLFAQHVEAKRMGGGMNLGRQSNSVTRNQNALPPKPVAPPVNAAPRPNSSTPAATPTPSRFGGMGGILGGIAAGIGLSYLFSSMGMGAGMASMFSNILMIGLLVFGGLWLYRKFIAGRNPSSAMGTMNNPSYATSNSPSSPSWNSAQAPVNNTLKNNALCGGTSISNTSQIPLIPEVSTSALKSPIEAHLTPDSFQDKEQFLENAKMLFLQLQEASDQQNLEVLREYTTPELFALLRKDMLARTTATSFTQVLTLGADLIAVEQSNQEYLASVRFVGSIREDLGGPVEEFTEVWNWLKPISGNAGWILSGIQQIQ